jgi:ribosome-associated protein
MTASAPARPAPTPEAPARRKAPAGSAPVRITRRAPQPHPPEPDTPPTVRKRQVAAGPDAATGSRRRKPPVATPERIDQLVAAVRASLEDDKAEDILVLDVADRASFTDRMIIATGLVARQIDAMATHVVEALEKAGVMLRRDRIQSSPDWVLIDAGDLVVHLFRPEARASYALERMWGPESPLGETATEASDGAP